MFHVTFVCYSLNFIGCQSDMKGKFSKIFKHLLTKAFRGMKLKLGIHAYGISLSIVYVFIVIVNLACLYSNFMFP